jgi:hypothetical protein
MKAISRTVSCLAVAVALTVSCGLAFAKGGGGGGGGGGGAGGGPGSGFGAHPTQVKTSGTSAQPSSSAGPTFGEKRGGGSCGHHTNCVSSPPLGTQSGNDPRGPNRGPGHPVILPK